MLSFIRKDWAELATLLLSALLTLAVADYLLHFVAPPRHLREAEDGVRDLQRENPAVLVLGSSHARTFHAVGQELARRSGGERSLVAVPLENGKLLPYQWLLRNRLAPIIDQTDASGAVVKSRLRRFLLLTEWWDSCGRGGATPYWNLPARAWQFGDFVADFRQHGLTGYNRNYLQNRFRVMFADSVLVYDRTQRDLVRKMFRLARGLPVGRTPEEEAGAIAEWQQLVEDGVKCIGDPPQMAALREILAYAQARRLETTIVLFPRKPATLTARGKATTLAEFAAQVQALAQPYGAAVIDLTYRSPLTDADFMEDFDHVTADGNQKFAQWALANDLQFLLAPSTSAAPVAAPARSLP